MNRPYASRQPKRPRIVVIGAGPTGLAAGLALAGQSQADWLVLEASARVGGLSGSLRDERGFVWDMGGHVFFSSWPGFMALLSGPGRATMVERRRRAKVFYRGHWVDFPFQSHFQALPPALAAPLAQGLAQAPGATPGQSFAAWCAAVYGRPLAEAFFWPFNAKLWQTPLEGMSSLWVDRRVAPADGRADWGPNNHYFYPAQGGAGRPFVAMARALGDGLRLKAAVEAIDAGARTIHLADGQRLAWDGLISTMPLPRLLAMLRPAPPARALAAAARLKENAMWLVGLGLAGPTPAEAAAWMYFPEPEFIFSRLTNMAAHGPANLPGADARRWRAYLAEVPAPGGSADRPAGLVQAVREGLIRAGLAEAGERPVSVFTRLLPVAYPAPTLGREDDLRLLHDFLEGLGVFSRGRLGGWLYEIGNMDHAARMGQEAVGRLLGAAGEPLWDEQWALLKQSM